MPTKKLLLFLTIILLLTITQTKTAAISDTNFVSKTIVLKARINTEQFIKILSTSSYYNAIEVASKYIVNETVETTEPGSSFKVIAIYKPWYNPNYIILLGEIGSECVFIKAVEQVVDYKYPTGKLNEVLINELGLLMYLGVVVAQNNTVSIETAYVLEDSGLNRVILSRVIYSRPVWEQYLDNINLLFYRETRVMQTQPKPLDSGYEETISSTTSFTNIEQERLEERTNYAPLLYAFIIASILSILVYFMYKIL